MLQYNYQDRPLSVGDLEKLLCDIDNEVLSTHYYILFHVFMKIGYVMIIDQFVYYYFYCSYPCPFIGK